MMMKQSVLRIFVLACAISMLTACLAPKTPQEVTQAFWHAVMNNDADKVVEYSTLATPKNYDAFSLEWSGYEPSWGKIVIDGDEASVDTRFVRKNGDTKEERIFTTHLVQRNEKWLVDYKRTAYAVQGGAIGSLFGTINQFSNELSRQLQSSANDFQAEMERMGKELEEQANALGEQASKSLEIYSEQLRKDIEALKESIDRALKDHKRRLNEQDRRTLREVSADLDRDSKNLSEPTAANIAESSKDLGEAQARLAGIDGNDFNDYKQQWQQISDQFESRMQEMLDALSAQPKEQGTRF